MNVNFIEALPSPYRVFDSLCEVYSFFRLHGSYQCIGGIKTYSYTLFKLLPLGGIYSQITISNVNAAKLLEQYCINRDFVKPNGTKEGFGSVYFKVNQESEAQLMDDVSNLNRSRKPKKIKTVANIIRYNY